MTKVIIDRKRWLHAETNSQLLRKSDGKMCCLGFACLALGFSEEDIAGHSTPLHTKKVIPGLSIKNINNEYIDTRTTSYLMWTNDYTGMSDTEREARIIELGKKAGLEFEFVG